MCKKTNDKFVRIWCKHNIFLSIFLWNVCLSSGSWLEKGKKKRKKKGKIPSSSSSSFSFVLLFFWFFFLSVWILRNLLCCRSLQCEEKGWPGQRHIVTLKRFRKRWLWSGKSLNHPLLLLLLLLGKSLSLSYPHTMP